MLQQIRQRFYISKTAMLHCFCIGLFGSCFSGMKQHEMVVHMYVGVLGEVGMLEVLGEVGMLGC